LAGHLSQGSPCGIRDEQDATEEGISSRNATSFRHSSSQQQLHTHLHLHGIRSLPSLVNNRSAFQKSRSFTKPDHDCDCKRMYHSQFFINIGKTALFELAIVFHMILCSTTPSVFHVFGFRNSRRVLEERPPAMEVSCEYIE
jgi:hypothetical protein